MICRTLGKPHLLSESFPWARQRDTWRMFWPTNRPYHSDGSVVVLGELHRQRTGIRMGKVVGQSSLQDSFLICSRMLRAMPRYRSACHWFNLVFYLVLVMVLIFLSIFQVKGLDVDSLYISHIQVNQAQKQRRRTYRAHGRINRKLMLYEDLILFHVLEFKLTLNLNFFQLICHPPAILSWSCLRRKSLSRKRYFGDFISLLHFNIPYECFYCVLRVCLVDQTM